MDGQTGGRTVTAGQTDTNTDGRNVQNPLNLIEMSNVLPSLSTGRQENPLMLPLNVSKPARESVTRHGTLRKQNVSVCGEQNLKSCDACPTPLPEDCTTFCIQVKPLHWESVKPIFVKYIFNLLTLHMQHFSFPVFR